MSVELYINPMYNVLLSTVVVGKARSLEALNCEPYVNALAVQLSFILIISFSHCTGVPLGLLNSNAQA